MVKILSLILSLISCASAPIAATSGTDSVSRGKPLAADEPTKNTVSMYHNDEIVYSETSYIWDYCFEQMKAKYEELIEVPGDHSFKCVIDMHKDELVDRFSNGSYLHMPIELNLNGATLTLNYGDYWNVDAGLTINGGGGTIKTTRSSDDYNCSIFVSDGHLNVNNTRFESFNTNMKYPLFTTGSNLTVSSFEDCTFENCSSSTYGGAICMEKTKSIKLLRCTFNRCHAKYGGAVYVEDILRDYRTIVCQYCTFSLCSASHSGGALYIYHNKESDDTYIKFDVGNDTFKNCESGYYGGAIYMDCYYGEISLRNSKIYDCKTGSCGGGVYCHNNSSEIAFGEIYNCQAKYGGGIYINGYYSTLYSVSVHHCKAEKEGGGIYVPRGMNYDYTEGGIVLLHCDFHDNTPSDGNATMMASGSLVILFSVLSGVFLVSTGVFVYLYLRKRKQVSEK